VNGHRLDGDINSWDQLEATLLAAGLIIRSPFIS